jgi:putative FmdB family regulatory protein
MIGVYTKNSKLGRRFSMPIYEYECLDCGKLFEIFQKISDEPLKECQECHGHLNRLISMCSFQLKGTGWYVTDYKSGASSPPGNGAQRAEGKDAKSDDKPEAKKETKPEAKTETKTETTKNASAAATGGT